MPELSIVAPVFNEADSLEELHRELDQMAQSSGWDVEMIFVDDGSTDDSWLVIQRLAESDERVRGIRLRRNFGKASALMAGCTTAKAPFIVTIDADLQDDPAEIPRLLDLLRKEDLDVVSSWKRNRQDPWSKRWPSLIFNRLVSRMSGVVLHDHNSGLKAYRREVWDEIQLYGERHRFIPVLAAARGFRIGELAVNHRPRKYGYSKYGWSRLPKGLLDLLTIGFLTGFNQRPQHVLGGIGVASFSLGAVGLVAMAIYWLLRMVWFPEWIPLHQRPIVLYSLGALLLGTQLLSMGFLAELLVTHAMQNSRQPVWSVRDVVNISELDRRSQVLRVVDDPEPGLGETKVSGGG